MHQQRSHVSVARFPDGGHYCMLVRIGGVILKERTSDGCVDVFLLVREVPSGSAIQEGDPNGFQTVDPDGMNRFWTEADIVPRAVA